MSTTPNVTPESLHNNLIPDVETAKDQAQPQQNQNMYLPQNMYNQAAYMPQGYYPQQGQYPQQGYYPQQVQYPQYQNGPYQVNTAEAETDCGDVCLCILSFMIPLIGLILTVALSKKNTAKWCGIMAGISIGCYALMIIIVSSI